jgi:hypothetical protein
MCNNLTYDPEAGDTKVRNNRFCCVVSSQALNELWEMLKLSLIVLQAVFPLCDYKVWIDTERGEEAKCHLRHMVSLTWLRMSSVPIGWRSIGATLTLPCSVRWIMTNINRSKRRRGHTSMRKHDVWRKRMSEVVRKCSWRASGHVLLRIDCLVLFRLY